MDENIFIVPAEDAGSRLDVFLTGVLTGMSRSAVQMLIEAGDVCIEGKRVKSNHKLKEGQEIWVILPEPEEISILPENIPLNILFEDKHVIVVNKPQGMVVHPAAGHNSGTLVNALLFHCGGSLSGINGKIRPGIVHRIDKDTSGVLVAAKTNQAHLFLSEQLAAHSMTRVYHALVHKYLANDSGTVNKPIGRSPVDRKKMAAGVINGKEAVTHYRVLGRMGNFTYVEARLETGRTHQIRVHMASIGHPLLGDEVYGRGKAPFHLEGQALHAKTLGFIHPETKKHMEFDTELPLYFQIILKEYAMLR